MCMRARVRVCTCVRTREKLFSFTETVNIIRFTDEKLKRTRG